MKVFENPNETLPSFCPSSTLSISGGSFHGPKARGFSFFRTAGQISERDEVQRFLMQTTSYWREPGFFFNTWVCCVCQLTHCNYAATGKRVNIPRSHASRTDKLDLLCLIIKPCVSPRWWQHYHHVIIYHYARIRLTASDVLHQFSSYYA